MSENEKICREKIHELIDAVLDINSVYAREREHTGNAPTAFLRFFGHTGSIDVDIHSDGWCENSGSDYEFHAYTYNAEDLDAAIIKLREFGKTLSGYEEGGDKN